MKTLILLFAALHLLIAPALADGFYIYTISPNRISPTDNVNPKINH